MSNKIDELDLTILKTIEKDARASLSEIADSLGTTRAIVHQRIQKMEKVGIIEGACYIVNPKLIGYSTCAYIGIKLEKGSKYDEVIQQLKEIPEVVECHMVTGSFVLLLKLYARNNEHLKEIIDQLLKNAPGIRETTTMISLEHNIKRNVEIKQV
ncbi:MAG: Lrp/AsnC family transcriptional regulator [Prevotellaceae bacterium]|nr:Lrp/AsnC family transcriptional regulator [Candidatus Faecinaster equi]